MVGSFPYSPSSTRVLIVAQVASGRRRKTNKNHDLTPQTHLITGTLRCAFGKSELTAHLPWLCDPMYCHLHKIDLVCSNLPPRLCGFSVGGLLAVSIYRVLHPICTALADSTLCSGRGLRVPSESFYCICEKPEGNCNCDARRKQAM